MFQRIVYSLNYRLGKINSRLIKGKNNRIDYNGSSVIGTKIEIFGNNNHISFSEKSIIGKVLIHISGNDCEIKIGTGAHIKSGELWIEDNGGRIVIGNDTTIENAHIAVTENKTIRIGNDCMIANHVEIRTGDSHSILCEGERINPAKDVSIGDHVWIGNRAMILKGGSIQENSIVASGCILTKAFDESGVLVGGVPGKVLKRNITWLRERI